MHTAARVKAWHEAAREVCGILFFSGTLNINLFAHAQDWMSGLLLTKGDSHGVLYKPFTLDGMPCTYIFGTEPKPKHSQLSGLSSL